MKKQATLTVELPFYPSKRIIQIKSYFKFPNENQKNIIISALSIKFF